MSAEISGMWDIDRHEIVPGEGRLSPTSNHAELPVGRQKVGTDLQPSQQLANPVYESQKHYALMKQSIENKLVTTTLPVSTLDANILNEKTATKIQWCPPDPTHLNNLILGMWK